MIKEDPGAKANRKAKNATAESRRRRAKVESQARHAKADPNNGAKSLLRKLFGG